MKIFCTEYPLLFHGIMGKELERDFVGELNELPPNCFMRGDSAIINSGKVLVRPRWIKELSRVPLLVIRLSKVGKSIPPQKAHEYYNEVALGVGFADMSLFQKLRDLNWDPSVSYSFDGSLFLSSFLPKETLPPRLRVVRLSEGVKDESIQNIVVPETTILQTIIGLSHYYLLKMGDLITFPLADSFEVERRNARYLYEGPDEGLLLDLGVRVFPSNFANQ